MSAAPPELLAALEVERLRAVLDIIASESEEDWPSDPGVPFEAARAMAQAALDAPPPDLGPLRELVAAFGAQLYRETGAA